MDMIQELSKPLTIDQVSFRVQSISAKGWAKILVYKDARTDMQRLDDVCGMLWQRDHRIIDGNLYCGIGIKVGEEWVWRWDIGTESSAEKEKGESSDAFKRAGFNWGIGRELYAWPKILLQLGPDEFATYEAVINGKKTKKGKQTFKLKLEKWRWSFADESNTRLIGRDETGLSRFDSAQDFNGYNASQPRQQIRAQGSINKGNDSNKASLERCATSAQLKGAWENLPDEEKTRLAAVKDTMKAKLTEPQQ